MPLSRSVPILTAHVYPFRGAGVVLCALLALLSLLLPLQTWAGWDEATSAYGRGDYTTAFQEWWPLAQAGDAKAQFNLGLMYEKGRGVSQDYAQALTWYRRAAAQGNVLAQVNLGVTYEEGQGVPQDYQQAYFWYNLAAAHVSQIPEEFFPEKVVRNRDRVAAYLTPAQLAEAQAQARTWQPKPETPNVPPVPGSTPMQRKR
jgi:hypothetical protein